MAQIHSSAIIDPKAELADDVVVGPYSVIGPNVKIGSGTEIGSHVVIKGPTEIGSDNKILQFASLGEDPQDLKYQGEETLLAIGDRNVIREYCTINRGTIQGGGITSVGHDNLLMCYAHVAHDCRLNNNIILCNYVGLAGHIIIDDYAICSGFVGINQFCHVGAYSFAAAGSMINKDVLPFVKVSGYFAKPFGLNTIGLKRKGFSEQQIEKIKGAYRIIYRQNLTFDKAIEELKKFSNSLPNDCMPHIQIMIDALKRSSCGIVR